MRKLILITAALAAILTTPAVAAAHSHHHSAGHRVHHHARAHRATVTCKWSTYFEECFTPAEERETEASVTEAFEMMEAEGWHEPAE